MGITDFLLRHSDEKPISFHMPGHKGSRLFRRFGYDAFLDNIADMDITEIPGADNLFQAEGIIAETMERYRHLYDSRRTYLLINGSSSGLISAIMAVTNRGDEMIVARNCHKSIFNGLEMAGVRPVYAYPDIVDPYGISGPVSPEAVERCVAEHPAAAAVILPSPNYYGICSDISSIADVVHRAGKVLIVDQAHGAHLKFFGEQSPAGQAGAGVSPAAGSAPRNPRGAGTGLAATSEPAARPSLAAEELGADIVIGSTHKTLASFTESAIANIMTNRIDLQRMEDALGKMESTSPSYVLMASLDVNADLMEKHGTLLIAEWKENIERFYKDAEAFIPGLRIMDHPLLDRTKINLDMSAYGLTGHALERALNARGIWPELVTGEIVMCMTGIGNEWADYQRLLEALQEIACEAAKNGPAAGSLEPIPAAATVAQRTGTAKDAATAAKDRRGAPAWSFPVLEQRSIPADRIELSLGDAVGAVCARALIPYPPGIPIVCPGEVLTEEICQYVAELRRQGENVMGLSAEGTVSVGK